MDNNEKTARENARLLAEKAATVLDSKKGVGITLIELSDETIITDYFVIATGTSSTHVKTLADEVEYKLSLEGITPTHTEGTN
ncbi:MAG TPA: RsfS/YbeB/iojap family protein, partial [Bacillota bacterium]|nr:RsfS/YbeB/iojap family protein [Bacillota bacterium]